MAHLHQRRENFYRCKKTLLDLFIRLLQVGRPLLHLGFQRFVQLTQSFVLLQRESFQTLLLALQCLSLEGLAHGKHHVFVGPWLGDVAIDFALVDSLDGGTDIGIAREKDAHRVRPLLLDCLEKLDSVHVRHAHVGDDQIHRLAAQNLQSLRAAFSHQHPVTSGTKKTPQSRKDIGLVIDK